MSGGPPPHHPHGRQAPSPNTAWNHLQVPNFFPRQPQLAHMSNEHPVRTLHQPTWHTPTTEPVKGISHSHLFNLEQMLPERSYPRHSPGVDLSLQKNGSQNGDLPTTPISLSVRDANKINSLPAGAIDVPGSDIKSLNSATKSISPALKGVTSAEMKCPSPVLKSASTGIKSPLATSPGLGDKFDGMKNLKRPTKRMESILERLNPGVDKSDKLSKSPSDKVLSSELERISANTERLSNVEKSYLSSTITQGSISSNDENFNSNTIINNPAIANARDEEVISPFSNEDSTDSNKSRRKRKPCKAIRVSKDVVAEEEEKKVILNSITDAQLETNIENIKIERRRSGSEPPESPSSPNRTRRKTSSESETIDNIAAMIQSTEVDELGTTSQSLACTSENETATSNEVVEDTLNSLPNVKDTNDTGVLTDDSPKTLESPVPTTPVIFQTPAQKKMNESNCFVEVENKLEEMFAGISDDVIEPAFEKISVDFDDGKNLGLEDSKIDESDKISEDTTQLNDSVTSTSNDLNVSIGKRKRRKNVKGQSLSDGSEISPKKKKNNKKPKSSSEFMSKKLNAKKVKVNLKQTGQQKIDVTKETSCDSGSNTGFTRSRGPFIQIKGSRDSPISVSVINTPSNEDDNDKRHHKSKKYHDDMEYRHKVRSKGLHCSTLSNKYDAQTRDATWICVFCKRGPHVTDPHLSGPSRFIVTSVIPAPGDLFGPYVITSNSPEYQRRLEDPYDQQFKSKKVARAVTAVNKNCNKKIKRKHSDSFDSRSSLEGSENADVYLGITETRDKVYEVWAHEDCIVWSSGVYLVGPRIVGLEEAVWVSCSVVCNKCRYKGANVCCVTRGCMSVVHFGCAFVADWYLDTENYKAYCSLHKP